MDINISAETDEYPSLRFQDIKKKSNCHGRTDTRADGRTDNVKPVYPTTNKVCGDIERIVSLILKLHTIHYYCTKSTCPLERVQEIDGDRYHTAYIAKTD